MAAPRQLAWKKIKRNKPALLGLIFVALCGVLAILGYSITPDKSPGANDQMLDIQLKSPGYTCQLLKVRKNRIITKRNFFQRLTSGEIPAFSSIPISNFEIINDSISFLRPEATTKEYLHLADVIYPLNFELAPINGTSDFKINTLDQGIQSVALVEMQEQVKNQITTRTFWLGTDVFGRDLLSRLLIGLRISLLVGLIAVVISLTIGIFIGAIGGYFGGRIDDLIMLLVNTVWSIPTLLLVFAIVLTLGKGISNIFIAVGLTMWVEVARIVRGQVMSFRKQAFVEAAQSMGFNNFRIIFRHILPNVTGPLLVIAAANFATAILIEAGLSYLGFGIEPPQPSWGTMLNENYGYALSGKPLVALVPALAILLLVLSFNLLGNGLRDAIAEK